MGGADERDVLRAFESSNDPAEPLATGEVAAAVERSPEEATDELEALAEQGLLESKEIGGTRAWWRPQSAADSATAEAEEAGEETDADADADAADPDSKSALHPEDHTIVERVLEASPVSIVVVEPSGDISFTNERAEELLGLGRDEITSRTYRRPEWDIYHGDGTPVTDDEHPVTRVLKTGEPDFGFEHWIRLPNGTERWLSSNSAPVVNDDGEVEYVVVGFEDATPLKEREDKLTSEKMRLLELYSEQLFEPFLDAVGESDEAVRIDVDEVVTLPDETTLLYLSATGIPAKAASEAFERQYSVLDARLLRSTDGHAHLEVHVDSPTVPLVFADLGGQVLSLVRAESDGEPVLVGELPGDVDPRTVVQAARRVHPDVELVSQELRYSPHLLYDIVEDALTDRQFVALQVAYYGGYFDTPRASTGDELADRLGITRQTFNQHLRKAERAVFEQLFEESGKAAR